MLCIAPKYSSNYIKRNPFHTVATTLQVPMENSSETGTACGSNNSDTVYKEIHGTEEVTLEVPPRDRSETDTSNGSDNGDTAYKTLDIEDAIEIAEDIVGEARIAGKRMVEIDRNIIRKLLYRIDLDDGGGMDYMSSEWYQRKLIERAEGRQWRLEMGYPVTP